jgi:hypothetical protein
MGGIATRELREHYTGIQWLSYLAKECRDWEVFHISFSDTDLMVTRPQPSLYCFQRLDLFLAVSQLAWLVLPGWYHLVQQTHYSGGLAGCSTGVTAVDILDIVVAQKHSLHALLNVAVPIQYIASQFHNDYHVRHIRRSVGQYLVGETW